MTNEIVISVLFACHNGEKRLRRTLDSFAAQDFPFDRWELIAVDNNSNDNTFAILQDYRDRLPIIAMQHAAPGKSRALNAGLERVRGRLLVLTDDDVRAERDWLSRFCHCADLNPDYSIFGGRIIPEWESYPEGDPLMKWIPMGSTFAIIDEHQSQPCEANMVWGPNTMIRRQSIPAGTRFREDIGPLAGGIYPMGQDQEFIMRLSKHDLKAYYCAEAIVHHWIPASNVKEEWVQRRGERLGYGVPALFPNEIPSGPKLGGVPLATWLESIHWSLRAALFYYLPRSKWRFWAIWKYYYMRGYRAGIRRFAPKTISQP